MYTWVKALLSHWGAKHTWVKAPFPFTLGRVRYTKVKLTFGCQMAPNQLGKLIFGLLGLVSGAGCDCGVTPKKFTLVAMQNNCCSGNILLAVILLQINFETWIMAHFVQFQVQNVILHKIYLGYYAKKPIAREIFLWLPFCSKSMWKLEFWLILFQVQNVVLYTPNISLLLCKKPLPGKHSFDCHFAPKLLGFLNFGSFCSQVQNVVLYQIYIPSFLCKKKLLLHLKLNKMSHNWSL